MENPDSWDCLTASIDACAGIPVEKCWEFLVSRHLVHDTPDARVKAFAIFEQIYREGPITGPSESWRIRSGLIEAGLATANAAKTDPGGIESKEAAIAAGFTV